MDSGKKLVKDFALSSEGSAATPGWDPYEVWRTKILLPRLAEQEADRLAKLAAGKRLYVVAPTSKPADELTPAAQAPTPEGPLSWNDEALKREMIEVLSSLLVIGLASTFYGEGDRRPPARLPVARGGRALRR
jgi:hypothetical protein